MRFGVCKHPQCPGHLAKYGNCLAQALHEAASSMVGYADEECGSVDWDGFYWLFICPDGITIPAREWGEDFDVRAVPGTYVIVSEDSDGAVELTGFDSEDDARAEYDRIERAYGLWSEEQDAREPAHV